jgi:hypothetical protein
MPARLTRFIFAFTCKTIATIIDALSVSLESKIVELVCVHLQISEIYCWHSALTCGDGSFEFTETIDHAGQH